MMGTMSGWRQVEALGFVKRDGVRATMARSMGGLVLFHPEPNHIDAQPNKTFRIHVCWDSGYCIQFSALEGDCGRCWLWIVSRSPKT